MFSTFQNDFSIFCSSLVNLSKVRSTSLLARLEVGDDVCVSVTDMEHKLLEERSAKQQLENRLMQLEKENSVLDYDYKQAKHELQELRSLKEKLTEEVLYTHLTVFLAWL